jgi:acyl-coenzyme A synthetase/AMP-(fatty) acid ligase
MASHHVADPTPDAVVCHAMPQARILYTAPTLIRSLLQQGDEYVVREQTGASLRMWCTDHNRPQGSRATASAAWCTCACVCASPQNAHDRSSLRVLGSVGEPINE